MDALALLGQLESVARASLQPSLDLMRVATTPPQRQPASQAQAQPKPQARQSPTASPARPRFGSARREYQPALNDSQLVQALVELQKRRRSTTLIKGAPEPRFAPAAVPEVQAAPKQAGGIRRSVEPCRSILRPDEPTPPHSGN